MYQQLALRTRALTGVKNVVFYCPAQFHVHHIEKIINAYAAASRNRVFLVCREPLTTDLATNITVIESTLSELDRWLVVDALVSTELIGRPYFFAGVSIYCGHGIGPKMNYQLGPKLAGFDYVLSPCRHFHEAFSSIFRGRGLIDVGVPLLDGVSLCAERRIILYAPSWCDDPRNLSDIVGIISRLALLENYRIVVSPHPNLICEGWLDSVREKLTRSAVERVEFIAESEFNTTFEVLPHCLLVVGDIGSSVYEALALGLPVVFDGNERIYAHYGAQNLLPRLAEAFYRLDDIASDEAVASLIEHDPKAGARAKFAGSYLTQESSATRTACATLMKII